MRQGHTGSTVAAPYRPPSAAAPLRPWQRKALNRYLMSQPDDFMVVATPGAGKTTFALRVARELLDAGTVRQVVIVAPTDHLKTQWAQAADRVGIRIDPRFSGTAGRTSSDYDGVAVTYAGVAGAAGSFATRVKSRETLVILDEIHHAGDAKSWGEAVRKAFAPATRRLALTGTPFRSDDNPIPFVEYEVIAGGMRRSVADFSYGYGDALADRVVRPVLFMSYSGEARWRTRAGDEVTMRLGEVALKEHTQRAWRTALDPEGDWVPAVLKAAHGRLEQLRAGGVHDAGGLVIASDQQDARAYAELLEHLTGVKPSLVLSDDRGSSAEIARFTRSSDEWIVAVRMVSEGVDIPRLGVLVYATNTSTPMFFAQAVGRVIRARASGESATVFLPSVPRLRALAHEMETTRDHVLGAPKHADEWDEYAEIEPAAGGAVDDEQDREASYERLGASADFEDVIFDGNAWGSQTELEDEQEFLGIPGLLEPDQVSMLLRQRQEQQVARQVAKQPAGDRPGIPPQERSHHDVIAGLRKELTSLVSLRFARTGKKHAMIHAELRRVCGGPPTPLATADQLQARIDYLRNNRD
ncbi:DEAD/DEAH box helicase [Blastococcus sp. Marseille-P5729]|uniref:DEAD/DEAH box helicase n=1 Tax=Blastococcus sp. Marseille-P5729 TaxID=2086582 RepID=UPI000D0FE6C3|nr:DEAD/DEAH box helicase [Blastococcus sp. Marseille-P5729]